MNRALLSAMAAILMAACSPKPAEPPVASTPTTRESTVIDPQLKVLDDAKKVQATIDEADRKRRKDAEDAGG